MAKRLGVSDKHNLLMEVKKILSNRYNKLKFPIKSIQEAEAFWSEFVTQEEVAALTTLKNSEILHDALNTSSNMKFKIGNFTLLLRFSNYTYCITPQSGFTITDDKSLYEPILSYCTASNIVRQQNKDTLIALARLVSQASSFGQLVRVWPELIYYIPNWARQELKEAKRASRVPNNIVMVEYRDNPMFNRILSEAHMLAGISEDTDIAPIVR